MSSPSGAGCRLLEKEVPAVHAGEVGDLSSHCFKCPVRTMTLHPAVTSFAHPWLECAKEALVFQQARAITSHAPHHSHEADVTNARQEPSTRLPGTWLYLSQVLAGRAQVSPDSAVDLRRVWLEQPFSWALALPQPWGEETLPPAPAQILEWSGGLHTRV